MHAAATRPMAAPVIAPYGTAEHGDDEQRREDQLREDEHRDHTRTRPTCPIAQSSRQDRPERGASDAAERGSAAVSRVKPGQSGGATSRTVTAPAIDPGGAGERRGEWRERGVDSTAWACASHAPRTRSRRSRRFRLSIRQDDRQLLAVAGLPGTGVQARSRDAGTRSGSASTGAASTGAASTGAAASGAVTSGAAVLDERRDNARLAEFDRERAGDDHPRIHPQHAILVHLDGVAVHPARCRSELLAGGLDPSRS